MVNACRPTDSARAAANAVPPRSPPSSDARSAVPAKCRTCCCPVAAGHDHLERTSVTSPRCSGRLRTTASCPPTSPSRTSRTSRSRWERRRAALGDGNLRRPVLRRGRGSRHRRARSGLQEVAMTPRWLRRLAPTVWAWSIGDYAAARCRRSTARAGRGNGGGEQRRPDSRGVILFRVDDQ
jgi:hypothetical protein